MDFAREEIKSAACAIGIIHCHGRPALTMSFQFRRKITYLCGLHIGKHGASLKPYKGPYTLALATHSTRLSPPLSTLPARTAPYNGVAIGMYRVGSRRPCFCDGPLGMLRAWCRPIRIPRYNSHRQRPPRRRQYPRAASTRLRQSLRAFGRRP